MKIQLWLIAQQ